MTGRSVRRRSILRRGADRARHVAARVAPLGSQLVLVLVEDRTRERRVEAIRRDFVANVSHELKTPVGALNLLAEAVGEAADDPEAVHRFAARMQIESERLDPAGPADHRALPAAGRRPAGRGDPVAVDAIVERAIDRVRVDATARQIDLIVRR